MGWLQSFLYPFKEFWARLSSTRTRRSKGIYVLYEDVKSCSCEDVHALWSILVDSDSNFAL
ncbi:unnamed protein product [Coffea canephora]|uniref:Uncharacterized protein n=1 Tax=Coffea canephora TaxID=49390 RepID=A0A068U0M4_COFCA|nr:unnamed protein product [Coffea canephora]